MRSLDVQPALADIESLVSVLPCASLLLAPDAPRFTIVAASDTYLRITATTRATLIGRGLFEVFPERPGEEGVDVLRASLDQVLAAGEPHEIPLQRYDVRRADGSVEERHWRERNSPVFGGHGVVRYVLHTVDDLTESVRSAAALELANRQLADVLGQLDILDQIGDGVIVFDRDWRVAYANSGTERLSGRRSSELRGQIFWDIWPQTVGTEVERQFHHAVASGGPVHLTTPYGIATTDGGMAERWFDVDAHPLTDGLAVFYRDVTERQRTREERDVLLVRERRARDRAERLQHLAAALSRSLSRQDVADVIVMQMIDALAGSAGGVLELSEDGTEFVLLSTVGFSPRVREEYGRFPVDTPTPAREVALSRRAVFLRSAEEWIALCGWPPRATTGTSGEVSGAWAALPLLVEDELLGALTLSFQHAREFSPEEREFMTAFAHQCAQALARARLFEAESVARAEAEQARREAELARAEAELARHTAEEANRAKSEFLAIMSHELRTPLNAIDGYAELMELGIHGPLTEAQREALFRVRRSQKHLLGLINQVLNYARLETGAVRYELTDVPVSEVLHLVEGLLAPQMRAKELHYTAQLGEAGVCVRADREKVQQILVNLLSNAVKFTPPGGTVAVDCAAAGSVVEIRVRDTGIGIPADKLDTIFEPFVQVDARLARSQEGVGLGLAISRDLAKGMGGNLVVESQVGRGSAFRVSLPRA